MPVQAFGFVRKKLGWTRYKMAKELGISQTQYDYLESKAKSTQTHVLVRLQEIAEKEAKIGLGEFWKSVKEQRK